MRITALVSAAAIALAATIGSVSAADNFATLNGVTADQMSPAELNSVTGLHVHFRVNGAPHATGEPPPASGPNGSTPGDPAPSYNGIWLHACGNGTITIVGGPQTCG